MKAFLLLCLMGASAVLAQPVAITEITETELMRQRDWCISNTYGGLFMRSDKAVFVVSKAQRDEKLKEVEGELARRRGGAPTFAGLAKPVLPPGMSWAQYRQAITDARRLADSSAGRAALARQKLGLPPATTSVSEVVESRIDGESTGYESGRLFKLQNGQIWEQADLHFEYRYAYGPEVLVYPSAEGGWKLKLGSSDRAVKVERVR